MQESKKELEIKDKEELDELFSEGQSQYEAFILLESKLKVYKFKIERELAECGMRIKNIEHMLTVYSRYTTKKEIGSDIELKDT